MYPVGKGAWEKGLNHVSSSPHPICPPPQSRELSLASDVNEILLNNHFILEIAVVPEKQHDLAAITGISEFFHLMGQSGGGG